MGNIRPGQKVTFKVDAFQLDDAVRMCSGGGAVGQLSCLYGFVAVQHDGSSVAVSEVTALRSGQRVQTQTGSKAQIVLPDQSTLTPDPRTTVQIQRTRHGPKILLEQGTISVEAAKQPAGNAITIEASQTRVKVLGTKLDVRLIEKPTGARQMRVRVLSGKVEMESDGRKVMLPAGTEGIADENQPPIRVSLVFEVNELIRLFNQSQALSGQPGGHAVQGMPTIVDLTTGTIWSLVPVSHMQHEYKGTTLTWRRPHLSDYLPLCQCFQPASVMAPCKNKSIVSLTYSSRVIVLLITQRLRAQPCANITT